MILHGVCIMHGTPWYCQICDKLTTTHNHPHLRCATHRACEGWYRGMCTHNMVIAHDYIPKTTSSNYQRTLNADEMCLLVMQEVSA